MKIIRATLDTFCIREPGTVEVNLTMVNRLVKVAVNELGLDTWLSHMVPFPLVDEVGIISACTIFTFSLKKGRHTGHLQWESMRKAPTAWANIYGAGSLGMGYIIYSKDRRVLMSIDFPARSPWFGNLLGVPS